MDGGLQILTNFGQNVGWAREEEGKNKEERGKGKNRASSGGRRVYVGRPLVPVRAKNRY